MKKIAIIGGGASGIFEAILLKKYLKEQIEVTIFEKMDRIGKKILATGNGKCNLTNIHMYSSLYNNELAKQIVDKYLPTTIISELTELGLMTHYDTFGRVYPITDSANTVLDIFLLNLEKYNVNIYTNKMIIKIKNDKQRYQIYTNSEKYDFDIVILATGGNASSFLGSNGEGYELAKMLGMSYTNIMPGLVGIKTLVEDVKGLNGLRQKATLTISKNQQVIFKEDGEVQFKEDGISGIVVMNASRYLLRKHNSYQIELDLLPELSDQKVKEFLTNYDILGILPKMLALKIKKITSNINEQTRLIKHYPITMKNNYGFDRAQVTIGGIDIVEVDENLESKKNKNLYIIGELLDVDGPCGGYNLHFAFASAKTVVDHIIKKKS